MSNEMTVFENQYLAQMANYALLETQIKDATAKKNELKAQLEDAMDQYDIKSIDNEYLKATRVAASSSTSIDLEVLAEKEPKLHGELLEDYPKTTNRKESIRITVKK